MEGKERMDEEMRKEEDSKIGKRGIEQDLLFLFHVKNQKNLENTICLLRKMMIGLHTFFKNWMLMR